MQPIYILEPISAGTSEIQVPADGRANVGREATNEFSFPHDLQMSSVHFEISVESGGCRIHDQGSTNGLFLNTKRIYSAIVVEGDEIQAGGSRWRLVVRRGEMASNVPESARASSPMEILPNVPPPATPAAWPVNNLPEPHSFTSELLLTTSDGSSRRLAGSQRITIGRTASAQWVFDDEQMSSCHMELSQQSGVWKVTDLDSSNGTFVNGSRVSEVELFSGDEIRGGRTRFEVSILKGRPEQPAHPPTEFPASANRVPPAAELDEVIRCPARGLAEEHAARQADASSNDRTPHASLRRLSDGQEFNLAPNQLVSLGRSPEAFISLASDLEVSTQHATLMFDGSCIQLRDVGSFNGTFVGGKRTMATELAHGDRLRVGKTEFVVCLPKTDGGGPSPAMRPLQEKPSAAVAADLPFYSNDSAADSPPQAPACGIERSTDEGSTVDVGAVDGDADESAATGPSADEVIAPSESERSPMWPDAPPSVSTDDSAPEPQSQVKEHPSPRELGKAVSANRPIDLNDRDSYAGQASGLKAVACRSGLFVYLGEAATLQPVDVCLSLLRATSGWVLNGSEIENWIEAASQGLSGLPREWLNPSGADDASWMLPFLGNWGSGSSWLVLSHVELEEGLHSLRGLRQPSEGRQPLLASLTPTALAEFLTEQDSSLVEPFFAPFDAILMEVGKGERWALVGRLELEAILQSSDI